MGADSGAYEKASFVDSVVMGPSERAIIDVHMPKAGVYEIQNRTPDITYSLGMISITQEKIDVSYESEFNVLRSNPVTIQNIDLFRGYFDKTPDKRIVLTLEMGENMPARQSLGDGGMNIQGMGHNTHQMQGGSMMGRSMMSQSPDGSTTLTTGGIEWDDTNQMMNAMSNTDSIKWKIKDQNTGKENMDIDWVFKRSSTSLTTGNEPVKIRIFNDPNSMHPMQHPIHFHGQRFLVVARDGVKQTNLVWKDTVLVKSGETVDIILDPSNPGLWMAHCHISEHLEAGMMFSFKVE